MKRLVLGLVAIATITSVVNAQDWYQYKANIKKCEKGNMSPAEFKSIIRQGGGNIADIKTKSNSDYIFTIRNYPGFPTTTIVMSSTYSGCKKLGNIK